MTSLRVLRIAAMVLLIFNGISASFGGGAIVLDPEGISLGMPVSWLEHSPFNNYLIPGIILFLIIGIGSIVTFILTYLKIKHYPIAIISSGGALVIWIITQILMIQMLHFLQFLYGGTGILLVILGTLLRLQYK